MEQNDKLKTYNANDVNKSAIVCPLRDTDTNCE